MTPKMSDKPRAIRAMIKPQINPFIRRKVREDNDSTTLYPTFRPP
jgi:hypothetical protein